MSGDVVLRIVSDGGAAFGLSDAAYLRWWESLPPEDQQAFALLGGDDMLGRFVCAYEYVCSSEGEDASTLVRAFSIATGLAEQSNETKRRAAAAWESPAVRELLDRLASREGERATRRIDRSFSALVEDTIQKAAQSDNLDLRSKVIGATARYLTLAGDNRKQLRDLRSRLLKDGAMKAITQKASSTESHAMSADEAEAYLRSIASVLGPERVLALMSGDAPEP